jgi:hypothetical protein
MFNFYDPNRYVCKYIKVDNKGQFHCPYKEEAEKKEIEGSLSHERRMIIQPECPSDVRIDQYGAKLCYIMRR